MANEWQPPRGLVAEGFLRGLAEDVDAPLTSEDRSALCLAADVLARLRADHGAGRPVAGDSQRSVTRPTASGQSAQYSVGDNCDSQRAVMRPIASGQSAQNSFGDNCDSQLAVMRPTAKGRSAPKPSRRPSSLQGSPHAATESPWSHLLPPTSVMQNVSTKKRKSWDGSFAGEQDQQDAIEEEEQVESENREKESEQMNQCSADASESEEGGEHMQDKEALLMRVLAILSEGDHFISLTNLAQDEIVKTYKHKASGWLTEVLSERPDAVTLLRCDGAPCVCLPGYEEELLTLKKHTRRGNWEQMDFGDAPLLLDPRGLAGKKAESLLQNKLKEALSQGDLRTAEALLCEAKHRTGVNVNAQKFNWIIQALVRAQRPEDAARWVGRMEQEFEVPPTQRTYVHLMDGFAMRGNIDKACHWFGEMQNRGFAPDIRSLNNMIKACCRHVKSDPDMSSAQVWLQRIGELGLKPDAFSYGNMIGGCERRHDVLGASHWFLAMEQAGITPSIEVFTFALGAATSAPKEYEQFAWEFAEKVARRMRELNVTADSLCWNKLVQALGEEHARHLVSGRDAAWK